MFLVCGEALYDVFLRDEPGRGPVGLTAVIGGSPLNVAIGLARQGERAGFFAGLSEDPLGARLAAHIAAEGVDGRYLCRKPNPTTLSLVSLGSGGVPHYTFYGHAAADISLTLADLPVLGPEVTGVHAGSYTLVAQPVADAVAALLARERHRLITLDPNIRPTVEPDMAIWRRRIDALLPHVAVVKASDEDLDRLHPGEPPERIALRWLDQGPAVVIITRGPNGAVALTRRLRLDCPAPPVAVVDTVGAGDTFQATLIAGLLAAGIRDRAGIAGLGETDLAALLTRCCHAAAITCGRHGADLPSRDEIDRSQATG